VLCAFGAVGIAAKAASLQGFDPSAGWGAPSPDFSTCGVPGSLGVSPPWDIPLPDPWPRGCHERPDGRPATTPNAAFTDTVAAAPARPPLAFREGTLCGHRTLCFKFQRTGKLACLARGRRSLEVFVLVPGEPGLRTSTIILYRRVESFLKASRPTCGYFSDFGLCSCPVSQSPQNGLSSGHLLVVVRQRPL
jgi:hypothetical protein